MEGGAPEVLLDEAWLADLLAPPVPLQLFPHVEPTVAPAFEGLQLPALIGWERWM